MDTKTENAAALFFFYQVAVFGGALGQNKGKMHLPIPTWRNAMSNTQAIFAPIEAGNIEEVKALLAADPGLAHVRRLGEGNEEGQTPLCVAATAGHLDIVKLLVDAGARVYELGPWYPPVEQALWAKQQHVVDYFLGEAAERADGTAGLGIDINLAARNGWADYVRKHVDKDPLAVYARGVIGDTPLHWPAHNGHEEIVALLLDAGAPIEGDAGLYGGKPLHWAAEHAPGVVRLLLARGAEVDSRNLDEGEMRGFTPLIMCAKQKDDCAECAELLLAAGADANARAANGKSALDYATAGGHEQVAAVLRKYGAEG